MKPTVLISLLFLYFLLPLNVHAQYSPINSKLKVLGGEFLTAKNTGVAYIHVDNGVITSVR